MHERRQSVNAAPLALFALSARTSRTYRIDKQDVTAIKSFKSGYQQPNTSSEDSSASDLWTTHDDVPLPHDAATKSFKSGYQQPNTSSEDSSASDFWTTHDDLPLPQDEDLEAGERAPWRPTQLMSSWQPRKRPLRNSDLDVCGRPTGLQAAAAAGNRDKVERLLDLRADINAADQDGNTALHLAAVSGHGAVALVLLDRQDDLSVDARTRDGHTALCLAAKHGHNGLVLQLLGARADVRSDGRTALHFAAESRRYDVLMTLLNDGGADINSCTGDSQSVLVSVAENGDYDVVLRLLQQEADVNAPGRFGRTALHVAAKDGEGKVVSQLLKRDANVNARTEDDETALSLVASAGHSDVVLELLQKWSADIHAAFDRGRIALHLAAKDGQVGLAELLFKLPGQSRCLRGGWCHGSPLRSRTWTRGCRVSAGWEGCTVE